MEDDFLPPGFYEARFAQVRRAFESAVFLYNSSPGSVSTVTVDNTHETADTAANLFDIQMKYGSVVTTEEIVSLLQSVESTS